MSTSTPEDQSSDPHELSPGRSGEEKPVTNGDNVDQSHSSPDNKEEEENPKKKKKWSMPSWLNHFNSHDLKIFFRCWVATWVATILIFIHPALEAIGQATFFAAISLYIVPPANILWVYWLAALSLLLGMCLAWAWGLITMKAAMAARPHAETQALLAELQKQAAVRANQTGQPVAWEAQIMVYDGFMLDTRVSVVYFVMGLAFVYVMARLRCSNPKFTLTQVFGTIVTDIVLLFGPLLPSFTPTLQKILVEPAAIGIGIGTVCCLLFFPQSTSYAVLEKMEAIVKMADTAFKSTRARLEMKKVDIAQLRAVHGAMIAGYKDLAGPVAFLPLDLSRGRWSADDVKGLHAPFREAMIGCLALIDFHIIRITAAEKPEAAPAVKVPGSVADGEAQAGSEETHKESKHHKHHHRHHHHGYHNHSSHATPHAIGHHQKEKSLNLIDALRNPELGRVCHDSLVALDATMGDTITACSESLALAARSINMVNTRRWIHRPSQEKFDELQEELQTKIRKVREVRQLCVTNTTEAVLDNHPNLFDEDGNLKNDESISPAMMQGLIISMVIEERLLTAAASIEKLLEHILRLTETRKRNRIWFPSRLQYAVHWILNGKMSISASGIDNTDTADPDSLRDPDILQQQAAEAHKRLSDSRVYYGSSARKNRVARAIINTYNWFTDPAGLFALRLTIVTFATAIPAVLPQTSGFFYREKGIWFVIAAQTCMVVYMADFVVAVLVRFVGTVVGGVLAVAAWYIGSGSGSGNPYGLGASTAVAAGILVWWRVFMPASIKPGLIMGGATFALVIGYSYDFAHIRVYGQPGEGYSAFWKRLVTVLAGFGASVIVQTFPKPPSATKHVCKTLANTTRTLADHYALLLSHWGRKEHDSPLAAIAEQISLGVSETLLSLNGAIGLLKVEMSLGPFDAKVLRASHDHCQYLNQTLGRLFELSASLPVDLQHRLAATSGMMDDRSIGDVMAVLSIIEGSLRTGSPLPERLPVPLVQKFYDAWHAQHRHAMLSKDLVRSEDYRRYCVGISCYLRFLTTLDNFVLALKEGLGECHIIYQWEAKADVEAGR